MPKKDKPWWTNGDNFWGGETFEVQKSNRNLGVRKYDVFRLEKSRKKTLVPHPNNAGPWKNAHNKNNPIVLKQVSSRDYDRAFSMMVTFSGSVKKLFLVQLGDGSIEITDAANVPGSGGDTASVRR